MRVISRRYNPIVPLILLIGNLCSSNAFGLGGGGSGSAQTGAALFCGSWWPGNVACTVGQCVGLSSYGCNTDCNQRNVDDSTSPVACQDSTVYSGTADCSSGACVGASFIDSTVDCNGSSNTCREIETTSSTVTCNGGSTCGSAVFSSSSVTCNGGNSCDEASFDDCSCCDGSSCPAGIPSCRNDLVKFCSTESQSQTCKEWGNPVCAYVQTILLPVIEPSPSPITPAPTPLPSEQPSEVPSWTPTGSPVDDNSDGGEAVFVPSKKTLGGTTEEESSFALSNADPTTQPLRLSTLSPTPAPVIDTASSAASLTNRMMTMLFTATFGGYWLFW